MSSDDHNECELRVQPGDLNGLKGQLIKLLELFGRCLPLARVPAGYQKIYGRPLYVTEYGAIKFFHSETVFAVRRVCEDDIVKRQTFFTFLQVLLRYSVLTLIETSSTVSMKRYDVKPVISIKISQDVWKNGILKYHTSYKYKSYLLVHVSRYLKVANRFRRLKINTNSREVSNTCRTVTIKNKHIRPAYHFYKSSKE